MSLEQLGAEHRRLRDLEEKATVDVARRPSDRDAKWLLDAAVRWRRYVADVRKQRLFGEAIQDALGQAAATGWCGSSDPDFEAALSSARSLTARPYRDALRRDFRRVRLEVRTLRRTLNACAATPRRTGGHRHRPLATPRRRRTHSRAGPSSPSGGDEPPPDRDALDEDEEDGA